MSSVPPKAFFHTLQILKPLEAEGTRAKLTAAFVRVTQAASGDRPKRYHNILERAARLDIIDSH